MIDRIPERWERGVYHADRPGARIEPIRPLAACGTRRYWTAFTYGMESLQVRVGRVGGAQHALSNSLKSASGHICGELSGRLEYCPIHPIIVGKTTAIEAISRGLRARDQAVASPPFFLQGMYIPAKLVAILVAVGPPLILGQRRYV
jgi:hypothetical protein